MSILDDILFNAKSAVNEVGKKANVFVDNTKLKFNAAELRGELKKKYEELGRLVYLGSKEEVEGCREEIDACIESITEINTQLKNIDENVQVNCSKRKCPACDSFNPKDAIFCNKCGTKIVGPTKSDDIQE